LPGLLAGLHGRLAFQKAEGAHALTRNHWKPKHNSIYLSIYLCIIYVNISYIIYDMFPHAWPCARGCTSRQPLA
jgi:hypothetical protein